MVASGIGALCVTEERTCSGHLGENREGSRGAAGRPPTGIGSGGESALDEPLSMAKSTAGIIIRPCEPSDYEAVARLLSAAYPEHPTRAAELAREDAATPERIRFGRLVLEHDGIFAGHGYYGNMQDVYDPHLFWVSPTVHPDYQGRGFGRALYRALEEALAPYRPSALFTWSREDWPHRTRFFLRRGFVEVMRSFESRLDLDAFEEGSCDSALEKLAAAGIHIGDLGEFEAVPGHLEKLYRLHTALDAEVPTIGRYTPPPYEEFVKVNLAKRRLVKETYVIAWTADQPIGLTELFFDPNDPGVMTTGLTGVLDEYRGLGVALAMKVRALKTAKLLGYEGVRTWNAGQNEAMLRLNMRLGFRKRPASIEMKKDMS